MIDYEKVRYKTDWDKTNKSSWLAKANTINMYVTDYAMWCMLPRIYCCPGDDAVPATDPHIISIKSIDIKG